jgi:uncharacterized protein (TIGR00255 family)
MTGFGRGETKSDSGALFTAEIRTLNHKFQEMSIKLPEGYLQCEPAIRTRLAQEIARGRADVFIKKDDRSENAPGLILNHSLVQSILRTGEELRQRYQLQGHISLETMLNMPGVFQAEVGAQDNELDQAAILTALELALGDLNRMRLIEGNNLSLYFQQSTQQIRGYLGEIERQLPTIQADSRQALTAKLKDLSEQIDLDENRLAQELVFLAERSDITEELTRMKSHLEQFDATISSSGSLGKKLDFILQELMREINTISAKSNAYSLTHLAIELKTELSKLREQIQNIE